MEISGIDANGLLVAMMARMKKRTPRFADAAHKALVQSIENYCDKWFLEHSRFGILAVKDPNLVDDLRDGRKLRKRTFAKVAAHLGRRPPGKWGDPVTAPSDRGGSDGAAEMAIVE